MATKTINIDGTRAYNLLKKAVERKGADYVTPKAPFALDDGRTVNTRARYTHKGKSLCLVGHALSIAGVTQAEMDVASQAANLPDYLPPRVKLTGSAANVFQEAQVVADGGAAWGTALAQAFKVAPVSYQER